MSSPDAMPEALQRYVTERLDRIKSAPLDQRARGELQGALDVALMRGDLTEEQAATWRAQPPTVITRSMSSHAIFGVTATPGLENIDTHGTVTDAPAPVPAMRRRVEPDRVVTVDGLLGLLDGRPLRLMGVGLFPDEVHLAIAGTIGPELWALERARSDWQDSMPAGAPAAHPELSTFHAVTQRLLLSDDAGTDYVCIGGGGGGQGWLLSLDARYRPAPPEHARQLEIRLTDEDAVPVGVIRVPLPANG
ncbi:MAG: hypothetical protein ACYDAQ_07365 [Mycobacteriales bacterium]